MSFQSNNGLRKFTTHTKKKNPNSLGYYVIWKYN